MQGPFTRVFGGGPFAGGGGGPETHVVMLGGQSNVTSRAAFDGGADWPTDGSVLQVGRASSPLTSSTDGALINAVRPLDHWSQPQAGGFGPALQFSLDYLSTRPNVTLVLIPAGNGGTSFSANDWNPGDTEYEDMVARTLAVLVANPTFKLKGLVWVQGESDAALSVSAYRTALDAMFAELRSDLGFPTLPIVLVQLADDWSAPNPKTVIADTPDRVPYTALVATAGLPTFDGVHYTAAAYRTIGSGIVPALAIAQAAAPAVPAAVGTVTVTPGNTQLSLSWSAPARNRSEITDYVVQFSDDGGDNWTTFSDGTSTTPSAIITGLTNDTEYSVRVAAVNSVGQGAYSSAATGTPVEGVPGVEDGAVGHWLLGSDGETLAGGSLTVVGTAPALEAGYANWGTTRLRGYNTGIADASTISYWVVMRQPTQTANGIIAGNTNLLTGRILFYANSPTPTARVRTDPGGNLYDVDTAFPANTWVFLAVSFDGTDMVLYRGDATTPLVVDQTITAGTLKSNIGIGDIGLNNAAVNNSLDVAEFGVFNSAKSEADWGAIYARSVSRMAARGITVI